MFAIYIIGNYYPKRKYGARGSDMRSVIHFQNHQCCYSKTHRYPFETF